MVSDAMRAVVRQALCAGELVGGDVHRGVAEHPVCGDSVQLSLRLDGDRIVEVAWQASGCPACLAVAAATAEAWRGVLIEDAKSALQQRVQALGGLDATERHALGLVLRTLPEVRS